MGLERKANVITFPRLPPKTGSNRSTRGPRAERHPNQMGRAWADICEQAVCVVAITPVLRAIAPMAADELDSLVFQMAVESVGALSIGFTEKAAAIAARSRGLLLFDVRVDGDAAVQRIAAIRYPSDRTGVLALDIRGVGIRHCIVGGTFSALTAPLENWTGMPLSMQAKISVDDHATLFLGALREAGHLPISQPDS
ncbi:conserved hypothetical protein [Mesorhizobium sp. ORS 3359]|nr:conserved hypothetical protein [Mesorhizobium sp. ORS 3359]